MPATTRDPVESIPPPETVRRMLADSVRRSDLLRALLRIARRKEAHDRQPSGGTAGRSVPIAPRNRESDRRTSAP